MKINIIEKKEKVLRFGKLNADDIFSFKKSNAYSEPEDIILRLGSGYVNLINLTFVSDDDRSDTVDLDTEIIKHELIEFTVKRG